MIDNKIVELEDIQDIGTYFIEFKTHMPYDGCFWTYNYLLVRDNEIIDILISTKEKIKTVEQLKAYQDNNTWRNDNFIVYDVIDGLNLDKFPYSVLQGLNDKLQDAGIDTGFTCNECGNFIENPECIESTGYTGNGGVGIELTDGVCMDCYRLGTCSNCGEYAGPYALYPFNHNDLCEYCLETALSDDGFEELNRAVDDCLQFDGIDLETPLYEKLYKEYDYVYISLDTKQIRAYNTGLKTDYKTIYLVDILQDGLALLFYECDREKLQNARLYVNLKATNGVLFTV